MIAVRHLHHGHLPLLFLPGRFSPRTRHIPNKISSRKGAFSQPTAALRALRALFRGGVSVLG